MSTIPLGIDIAKDKFDVVLLKEGKYRHKVFANQLEGYVQLGEWLKQQGVAQVHACLEATGHYGEDVAAWLDEAGHLVSIVNPACIKAFAESQLSRNKTDKGDAKLIARYCQTQQPPQWIPPSPEVRQLQSLVRQLEALQSMLCQESNRLSSGVKAQLVVDLLQEHIAFLTQQIERIQRLMQDHINNHPELKQQQELLLSIPGIAQLTATKLLAENISAFQSVRQLAAYAGVTPQQRVSGSSVRGKTRLCKTGNAALRKALYMPAMSAKRFNPLIKSFCERLQERGKAKKAIICAAMHKLLSLAFGVLKSGQRFDPNYANLSLSAS